MNKIVRLDRNIVVELIPPEAMPVEKWYGKPFAELCVEAPDYVMQNWIFDPENGTWSEPSPPSPPEPAPDSLAEVLEALRILTGGADDELE